MPFFINEPRLQNRVGHIAMTPLENPVPITNNDGPLFHSVPNQHQAEVFDDLFRETNPPLESPTPDRQQLDPESRLYIERLIAQTGKLLSESQLAKFTGVTNKKEINKIFFGMESQVAEENKAANEAAFADIGKILSASVTQARKKKIADIKESIAYRLNESSNFADRSLNCLRQANEKRDELLQLEESPADFSAGLAAIKKNTFWKLLKVDTTLQKVTFQSGNVVLKYVNKTHGTNYAVNLGTFIMEWNIKRPEFKVLALERNIVIEEYAHPHITGHGSVCWGTANHTIGQALLNQDVETILGVTQSLMHTYNPDSPYVRLEEFFVRANPELMKGDSEKRPHQKAWIMWTDYDENFPFSVSILEEENEGDDDH